MIMIIIPNFMLYTKKIDKHNTNIIIKTIPVVFENNISALLYLLFLLTG